jgi:hypothetical protein
MEESGVISVWAGVVSSRSKLDGLMEGHYSDDGDYIRPEFGQAFSIDYFDEDFLGYEFFDEMDSVGNLLVPFSRRFDISAAVKRDFPSAAAQLANAIIVLHDFRYSGEMPFAAREGFELSFIGTISSR